MYPPDQLPQKHPSVSDSSSIDGESVQSEEEQRIQNLREFVKELDVKLSYPQKRALRVTWRRLSEAPKTSGRGNLQIMEKIFDRLVNEEPGIMSVFYRSAFIKCIEDRRNRCQGKSIATLRDHAHLLIDFVDGLLAIMFDEPLTKPVFDPVSVGKIHGKLNPLGFDRHIWLKLGECFAEVMFSQDCKPEDQTLRHSYTSQSIKGNSLTSTPTQSCRSLDVLDEITVPPNTQRTTQRMPRQLPSRSACGKYAAKKDAFKLQDRSKSNSYSNLMG
ncbi:hypothetical protein FO519_008262 [Halicephalobus sp. NKZ332]|nr:hypothetical protein FO519_008262 [Halicephalobus sp. NKZ332]